ncbi:hypothetical protein NL676_006006 [Syzygium grande]|nr:hypothetical protein NL676_006006 [Syzygium grande]
MSVSLFVWPPLLQPLVQHRRPSIFHCPSPSVTTLNVSLHLPEPTRHDVTKTCPPQQGQETTMTSQDMGSPLMELDSILRRGPGKSLILGRKGKRIEMEARPGGSRRLGSRCQTQRPAAGSPVTLWLRDNGYVSTWSMAEDGVEGRKEKRA